MVFKRDQKKTFRAILWHKLCVLYVECILYIYIFIHSTQYYDTNFLYFMLSVYFIKSLNCGLVCIHHHQKTFQFQESNFQRNFLQIIISSPFASYQYPSSLPNVAKCRYWSLFHSFLKKVSSKVIICIWLFLFHLHNQ